MSGFTSNVNKSITIVLNYNKRYQHNTKHKQNNLHIKPYHVATTNKVQGSK